MKINKQFTIDVEIVEELGKLQNASGLINEMLKDYFNASGHLKKEELKKKLHNLEIENKKNTEDMTKIREQIEKIESDEKRIKAIFKNIPQEIIEDFKFYPKMTTDTLLKRYSEIYSKRYEIDWEEVKKAWEEWKNGN